MLRPESTPLEVLDNPHRGVRRPGSQLALVLDRAAPLPQIHHSRWCLQRSRLSRLEPLSEPIGEGLQRGVIRRVVTRIDHGRKPSRPDLPARVLGTHVRELMNLIAMMTVLPWIDPSDVSSGTHCSIRGAKLMAFSNLPEV